MISQATLLLLQSSPICTSQSTVNNTFLCQLYESRCSLALRSLKAAYGTRGGKLRFNCVLSQSSCFKH